MYEAICSIANERVLETFTEGLGLIAHEAGVSWRTAQRHIMELDRLGLVKVERQTGPRAPFRYTVKRKEIIRRYDSVSQRYDTDEALPCRTSSTMGTRETKPPPHHEAFLSRFRSIQRSEFQGKHIKDGHVLDVLAGYDDAIIESALADLERDAPDFIIVLMHTPPRASSVTPRSHDLFKYDLCLPARSTRDTAAPFGRGFVCGVCVFNSRLTAPGFINS